MKLKDIFPRWALREPQRDGNLELGGSAFAHLTEVADHGGYLHADKRIIVTAAEDPYASFVRGAFIGSNGGVSANSVAGETEAFSVYDTNGDGNYAVWQADGDGSLHWGDGTAAPDVQLRRLGAAALSLDNGDGVSNAFVRMYGIFGEIDLNDGTNEVDIAVAGPGLLDILGNGAGLHLRSPNGTAYNVTVANDGTVTSVAA